MPEAVELAESTAPKLKQAIDLAVVGNVALVIAVALVVIAVVEQV